MKRLKVLAICGSLDEHASNSTIISHLTETYKDICSCELFKTEYLPYFTPIHDQLKLPAPVKVFYQKLSAADAILITTPEYIFSLPGAVKNALEWTVATNLLEDKPCCLIVAAADGSHAFESLQMIMRTLLADLDDTTNLHIRGIKGKIRNGEIICDKSKANINRAFECLIRRIHHSPE